jgi:hypothetical protein
MNYRRATKEKTNKHTHNAHDGWMVRERIARKREGKISIVDIYIEQSGAIKGK